jgi:hypothetical protein
MTGNPAVDSVLAGQEQARPRWAIGSQSRLRAALR